MTELIFDLFLPRLEETFLVHLEDRTMELTLIAVKKLPYRPFPGLTRDPFSLRFRSTSRTILPQAIYAMSNTVTGRIEIFIVPIARDAAGVVYEAIFN